MAAPAPGGFGRKLRVARERRGVSLRQIAEATKISVAALEALERNDISRLPGGIFSRAFVRAYALEVGLDPEETLQEFIAQFPHDSITAGHPAQTAAEDHEAVESSRQMANAFVRLILVSVPLIGLLLYFTGPGSRHPRSVPAPAPAAAPAPAPPAVTVPARTDSPAASESTAPAASEEPKPSSEER